jgi:hypothetical protein
MKMATAVRFSVKKTHIEQNLIFGGFFKKRLRFLACHLKEKRFFLIKQNEI